MKYKDLRSPWTVMKQMQKDLGWEKAGQVAYQYFNREYFKPLPNNHVKLILQYKSLMPGRLYTYKYDPLYKEKLDYYDERPMMLCIKTYVHPRTKNNLQLGINLNFLPSEMRVFVLEGIWKAFRKMIERDFKDREVEKEAVGRQKLLFTDNFDVFELLDYVLQTVGKTYWKFGIRQYIWERCENVKWIDYPDWAYLPLLRAKDLIGISEKELAKIYWQEKNTKGK